MHGTDARHARRGRPIYWFHDLQQPLTDRQDLALLVGRDRRPEAIHGQLDRLPLIKQSKKKNYFYGWSPGRRLLFDVRTVTSEKCS